jgi:Spy/CpxP family protein refolding chaperone
VVATSLAVLLSGFVLGPVTAAGAAGQNSSAAGAGPSAGRAQDSRPPGPSPSGRGGGQSGWEWWNDADVQKELGLTAEKIHQIDDFYQARVKALKPVADEWMKQSKELDAMTKAALVEEPIYSIQVLRVEALRSRLSESRTMMLYRIYRILQPEQYKKLQDILDRRFKAFNGRGRE